jgi:hypothetical protein
MVWTGIMLGSCLVEFHHISVDVGEISAQALAEYSAERGGPNAN